MIPELPDNIKRKIETYSDRNEQRKYGIPYTQAFFINAAEYGYILAQEEIERLKELIEKMFKDNCVLSHQGVEDDWQQFKQTHQL